MSGFLIRNQVVLELVKKLLGRDPSTTQLTNEKEYFDSVLITINNYRNLVGGPILVLWNIYPLKI